MQSKSLDLLLRRRQSWKWRLTWQILLPRLNKIFKRIVGFRGRLFVWSALLLSRSCPLSRVFYPLRDLGLLPILGEGRSRLRWQCIRTRSLS